MNKEQKYREMLTGRILFLGNLCDDYIFFLPSYYRIVVRHGGSGVRSKKRAVDGVEIENCCFSFASLTF